MQKTKINIPIPKWVVTLLIAIIVIIVLGLLAYFNVAGIGTGLIVAATFLSSGIFSWGGINWINGVTLWITLAIGFGIVYILIAKRRYLKAQTAYVQTQQQYVPRGSEITSTTLPTTPQVPQVVEPPKEEQT